MTGVAERQYCTFSVGFRILAVALDTDPSGPTAHSDSDPSSDEHAFTLATLQRLISCRQSLLVISSDPRQVQARCLESDVVPPSPDLMRPV